MTLPGCFGARVLLIRWGVCAAFPRYTLPLVSLRCGRRQYMRVEVRKGATPLLTRVVAANEALVLEKDSGIETYPVSIEMTEGQERQVVYVHL